MIFDAAAVHEKPIMSAREHVPEWQQRQKTPAHCFSLLSALVPTNTESAIQEKKNRKENEARLHTKDTETRR